MNLTEAVKLEKELRERANNMSKREFLTYLDILNKKAKEVEVFNIEYPVGYNDINPATEYLRIADKINTDYNSITKEVIFNFLEQAHLHIRAVERLYSEILTYYSITDDVVSLLKRNGFEVELKDYNNPKYSFHYVLVNMVINHPKYGDYELHPTVDIHGLNFALIGVKEYPISVLHTNLDEGDDYNYAEEVVTNVINLSSKRDINPLDFL